MVSKAQHNGVISLALSTLNVIDGILYVNVICEKCALLLYR